MYRWPPATLGSGIDADLLEELADCLPPHEWRLLYALRDGNWREPWGLVGEVWRGWYRPAPGNAACRERELGLHNLHVVVHRARAHLRRRAPELHILSRPHDLTGQSTAYRLAWAQPWPVFRRQNAQANVQRIKTL